MQVTLPDGWQAYGMLMEYIPGISLWDYAKGGLSPDQQIALVSVIILVSLLI